METGDAHLDEQHRQAIALVDQLEMAESYLHQTGELLWVVAERLMEFTVDHFLYEEQLMASVGYPAGREAEMVRQHRDFAAYARSRVMEMRAHPDASLVPTAESLRRWLVDHEFGLDRELVQWIRENGKEAA